MIRLQDDPSIETTRKPLTYDPNPTEIRQLCRTIQSRWSPAETLRRAGVNVRRPVEIAVVRVAEVVGASK